MADTESNGLSPYIYTGNAVDLDTFHVAAIEGFPGRYAFYLGPELRLHVTAQQWDDLYERGRTAIAALVRQNIA